MASGRRIAWDGFVNARDLGGLSTTHGGATRHGVFVRSGTLRNVTEAGWQEAYAAGCRTVIDLRNDDEVHGERLAAAKPAGIVTKRIRLDDVEDTELWDYLNREGLNGSPLYFAEFLAHKPARVAEAVSMIANAGPGAIIFHCGAGRDRTGLITMLLLAIAGAQHNDIADDYELSAGELEPHFAELGQTDQNPLIAEALQRRGTTIRQAILDVLGGLEAHRYLLDAGVLSAELAAIEKRFVEPAPTVPTTHAALAKEE